MIGRGWLGGLNVVVYTPGGQLGLFKVRHYGEIVRQAERNRITVMAKAYRRQGRDLKDLLDKLET
jgi:hypothetical protein